MAGVGELEATGSAGYRVSVLTPLHGRDGGVALHVAASAEALRSAGHSVAVVCARTEWAASGVTVIPGLDGQMTSAVASDLERVLSAHRTDVVHVHDLADRDVVELARRVAPTVITAHAYPGCTHNNHYFAPGEECHRSHGPGCLANIAFRGCYHARNPLPVPGLYRRTTRRMAAYRMADALLAHSRAVTGHLTENSLSARPVPMFTPLADLGAGAPAGGMGRTILFVGRIVPAKGLGVLLQALTMVDAELVVAGDGWWRAAAVERAQQLGLGSRVRFDGWLDGERLAAAYGDAAILALPSVWPEPFGLVGIEAMAFRTPVVASMTGGVPDWLEDGVTGIGVRPGDARALAAALNSLLDDPSRRSAMGEAGRSALERRFTAERHVRALEAVYAAVTSPEWRRRRSAAGTAGDRG